MSTAGPPPSTLSDVLAFVQALYVEANDRTPFYIGERYAEQEGAPPRIVIIPSKSGSGNQLGPVLEIGARQIGSVTEAAVCYVWGRETPEDGDRYRDAMRMVMRLFAAFNAAAPMAAPFGIAVRRLERGDQTSLVTFGEEYQIEIAYTWAVPRDGAIDAAAEALAARFGYSQSPQDPDRPNGSTGAVYQQTIVMENSR